MKTFREFVSEGTYPTWTRATIVALALRVRSLSKQIENETDVQKQNKLIAKQNNLISYISGMSIGISSTDKQLMSRMRSLRNTK